MIFEEEVIHYPIYLTCLLHQLLSYNQMASFNINRDDLITKFDKFLLALVRSCL